MDPGCGSLVAERQKRAFSELTSARTPSSVISLISSAASTMVCIAPAADFTSCGSYGQRSSTRPRSAAYRQSQCAVW